MSLALVGVLSAFAALLIIILIILAFLYKKNWESMLKERMSRDSIHVRNGETLTLSKVFVTASFSLIILAILEGVSAYILLNDSASSMAFPTVFPIFLIAIAVLLIIFAVILKITSDNFQLILWGEELEYHNWLKKKLKFTYEEIKSVYKGTVFLRILNKDGTSIPVCILTNGIEFLIYELKRRDIPIES